MHRGRNINEFVVQIILITLFSLMLASCSYSHHQKGSFYYIPPPSKIQKPVINKSNVKKKDSFIEYLKNKGINEAVLVNIPDQTLRYYKDKKLVLRLKVAVGNPRSPTPLFSTYITGAKINPDWKAPAGGNLERRMSMHYKKSEKYRKRLKDLGIIASKKEGSDGYSFYQPPGKYNLLGRMRLIMPNKYNVYVHDTPDKSIFRKEIRAVSAGCVRTERWKDLLKALSGLSDEEISRLVGNMKVTRYVRFDRKIYFETLYWTSFFENGKLVKGVDIYRRVDGNQMTNIYGTAKQRARGEENALAMEVR